jgi:hypothetical protein
MENIHFNPNFVPVQSFADTNVNHSKEILINGILSMCNDDEYVESELLVMSINQLSDICDRLCLRY